tara:strand:- start:11727 stop:12578 length:852 start_codon:yes stop_codon:yes gene_type:complete
MKRFSIKSSKNIENTLRKIGKLCDEEFEIGGVALLLGAMDNPNKKIEFYLDHLIKIASDVSDTIEKTKKATLDNKINCLQEIIVTNRGYIGDRDTYDDPQNANMINIIERRKGLPVGLGIIYLDVAHRLGWQATGINFPGHFLIRLEHNSKRKIIDPFNNGIERDTPDLRQILKQINGMDSELLPQHSCSLSSRETLIRLLNNIKFRAISSNNLKRAIQIMERMILIAPGQWGILQEASLFYYKIGNLKKSTEILEGFLEKAGHNFERREAETMLYKVKQHLH